MTSSNRNIFLPTGPLCGESNGHRWIPITKASDAELWCFFRSTPEGRLSKQSLGWDLRCHRAHYGVAVMNERRPSDQIKYWFGLFKSDYSILFWHSISDISLHRVLTNCNLSQRLARFISQIPSKNHWCKTWTKKWISDGDILSSHATSYKVLTNANFRWQNILVQNGKPKVTQLWNEFTSLDKLTHVNKQRNINWYEKICFVYNVECSNCTMIVWYCGVKW